MNLYLESSAALRDILDGNQASDIRAAISAAAIVVTSRLTLAEVGRVFARLRAIEPVVAARAAAREAAFAAEAELWSIQPLDEDIWVRCARPFPVEPVRVLDAIHLARNRCQDADLPFREVLADSGLPQGRWRTAG